MMKKYLRLEVIWRDEHMFELKVSANNGRYSGITEVYTVSKPILSFVNELKQFPFDKEFVTFSLGEKENYAFFEMKFYKIGLTSQCGVLVTL